MADVKSGKIIIKTFGALSKSRHEAVYLQCGSEEFVLRRKGDNPFMDNPLEQLKGRQVTVTGRIAGYVFWVDSWEEVD